jgi:hypothetical protein
MNFTLTRYEVGEKGAYGNFVSQDGSCAIVSMERTYLQSDGTWAPKIPANTYTCKLYKSPHFGYMVFQIMDVPGHDHIEIHKANWERQLDGCVALGLSEQSFADGEMIVNSKVAFDKFMALQTGVDEFKLTVI